MNEAFLRSELEADIAIRRDNLSRIKTMASRYSFRDDDQASWRRCCFPIIYAEWEGFFVLSLSLYFREINKLHLSLDDLSDKYFVRNAHKKFRQFTNFPEGFDKRLRFLKDLLLYFRNVGEVDLIKDVNTESNLGFKTANAILGGLDLRQIEDHVNHDAYSIKDELDKILLDKRNGLVHGDPASTVTNTQIAQAVDLVFLLMDLTKDSILEGYSREVFRV